MEGFATLKSKAERFVDFLDSKGIPRPPFSGLPSDSLLMWSRQDAWAQDPATGKWYFCAIDRLRPDWQESLNAPSVY